jgi:hypothetical protein
MGARSIYNYNADPHIKNIIDSMAPAIAAKIESEYAMTGPSDILTDIIAFYMLHGTVIVVKIIVDNATSFLLLHPEYDDVAIDMEPTAKLTLAKYLPKTQKEERLVFGDTNFKIYEGSLADISYIELLRFLGYSTQGII